MDIGVDLPCYSSPSTGFGSKETTGSIEISFEPGMRSYLFLKGISRTRSSAFETPQHSCRFVCDCLPLLYCPFTSSSLFINRLGYSSVHYGLVNWLGLMILGRLIIVHELEHCFYSSHAF